MVIKVCQGSPKALRNLLQAYHKKEFADMVKEEEEEEEKKFRVPHIVKNEVFPTEWVFSAAGNVFTPERTNLNPEKVEDLVVVKCNSRLL